MGFIFTQSANDIAQRQQALVDVDALAEPLPLCLGALDALAACQVDQVQLGTQVLLKVGCVIDIAGVVAV